MSTDIRMWEILVPTVRNDGRPFRLRFHRVWDRQVIATAGGLTVLRPAKGSWVSDAGDLYAERMIPVRVACTEEEIVEIAEFTKRYYDQIKVLVCRISDDVRFI